jgi:hypothetical protein
MMSKVALGRIEQLLLGITRELRPALAECDPTVSVLERGHATAASVVHLVRPTERVGLCDPGVHSRQDFAWPLSIRFQIVAGDW